MTMSGDAMRAVSIGVIGILVVAASPVADAKPSIIAADDLRARSVQMCSALTAHDARGWYDLMTPDFRTCNTYESWRDDFNRSGEGRAVSCKVTKIKPVGPSDLADLKGHCSHEPFVVESAAIVTLRVRLVFP